MSVFGTATPLRHATPEEERLKTWGIADHDAAADRSALTFTTADTVHGRPIPPREWLVPGLIPAGTVTMLGGDGGTGKSVLALQLAVAAAVGRQWIGRDVERPGPVLLLSAEDDATELHRRLADIADAAGVSLAELSQLGVCSLAGEDALLAVVDQKTKALTHTDLANELEARIEAIRPTLLVLDTLADLHAGEENNRQHARQFVGMLRGLAIRYGCAVLLLAHPSLAGKANGSGLSGSTAWNASVRSRLYLERVQEGDYEPDPDARRLVVKKANYGRTGLEIGLRWRAGAFVADAPQTGLDRMATGAKAERVFLKLLRQLAAEGRDVGPSKGHSYAPAKFAEHPDNEGVSKRGFTAAMDVLMRDGKVCVEEIGPPSRRTKRLVEAPANG